MVDTALSGGRPGIRSDGVSVSRPAQAWTPTLHRFLKALRRHGFLAAPEPLGLSGSVEKVSYIDGEVFHGVVGIAADTQSLVSAAGLLKAYHDASRACVSEFNADDVWMLPPRRPGELICHGDFAPYNVVFDGRHAVGIIDFDAAHPGPALWDVAYAVYRWAPVSDPSHDGVDFSPAEQCARARLFVDAYGLSNADRLLLCDAMQARVTALVGFMREQALLGDATFAGHIREGHDRVYDRDLAYLEESRDTLLAGLMV
jgi:hypothetical protein